MTTLEKIFQEIEQECFKCRKDCSNEKDVIQIALRKTEYNTLKHVEEIIKKHLSSENHTETTRQSRDNDGMISIDDDRLWNILFEEACVEGQQAERIHNRLKEICSEAYKPPVESAGSKRMREREEFFKDVEKI